MEETLKHVLEALRSTEELLRNVLQDKEVSKEKLTKVEVKLESIERELANLLHVIRGNGSPGLQVRTSVIEGALEDLQNKIESVREELKSRSRENKALYIAVGTGILGFLTSVAVAVINLYGS